MMKNRNQILLSALVLLPGIFSVGTGEAAQAGMLQMKAQVTQSTCTVKTGQLFQTADFGDVAAADLPDWATARAASGPVGPAVRDVHLNIIGCGTEVKVVVVDVDYNAGYVGESDNGATMMNEGTAKGVRMALFREDWKTFDRFSTGVDGRRAWKYTSAGAADFTFHAEAFRASGAEDVKPGTLLGLVEFGITFE
ncbi:type 1 fimbrial protein [Salmonella enterica]|nr:type 1 fimbrial protein [Salmonella enterica]EKF5237266.1 type 1 fimbrial protein [Salmonella enterica]ELH9121361.1 type 1 fimbrial protein [Salmonella enterica]ELH9144603.1 type 1 fimbrial protein [Salmonella enterica]EMD8779189.1 type 1 fimbrial protein [Salmonella enterica]